ncbi:MAG: hypothetical protein ACKO3N_08120 [Verrucomicrobiota bacterium]
MTDADRLRYDALTRQLERMRAMQYAYNRKFFTLLLVSTAGLLWAFHVPTPASLVAVCFGLVTAGVTASFFLHFCDFARVHARALERRLNRLLGERVLVASELEADYFYPHEARKFSGWVPGRRLTFFSFFTLHFCGVWGLATAAAGWRLHQLLAPATFQFLATLYLLWALANAAFLGRWFIPATAERRLARALREAYETAGDPR